MKYTQIPATTFQNIGLNAGILLSAFNTETGEYNRDDIIAATSGGTSFTAEPTFTDFGEDIDNCPKNTMELKVLDTWDVTMSGTMCTMDTAAGKLLCGVCDEEDGKIIPRADVKLSDFTDVWWVGDYDNEQDKDTAGFIAIHLMNGLNTGGLQITSGDQEKTTFPFEITGHYSIDAMDTVPFELYLTDASDSAAKTSTKKAA